MYRYKTYSDLKWEQTHHKTIQYADFLLKKHLLIVVLLHIFFFYGRDIFQDS